MEIEVTGRGVVDVEDVTQGLCHLKVVRGVSGRDGGKVAVDPTEWRRNVTEK